MLCSAQNFCFFNHRVAQRQTLGLQGFKVSDDNGKQCILAVGNTRLIARNGPGATPQVDHVAYAVANWNQAAIETELKRRGLNPEAEGNNSIQFKDPDGYHVQISAKA